MTNPAASSPRTIFIGDVHGMLEELDALLEKLELRPGDRLIFMGDLVDKGPDQVGVIRRVGELIKRPDILAFTLRGNHEDKHIRYRKRLADNPKIAREMAERSPTLAHFHENASEEDWNVLLTALPFWRDHEMNLLAVHGGIPGDMWNFPHHWDEVEHLSRHDQRMVEKVFRTRFINPDTGAFLANDHVTAHDVFWAEIYDGRFGHVIFGHQPFLSGIARFPHATGVDTGAVHGGLLSALILPPDGEPETLSVQGAPHSVHLVSNA